MAFQACTKRMRALLQDEAALHGWQLSVDMFASEANAVTPRFFTRSRSRAQRRRMPLPCWTGSSRCAACGERHRELIFAYLPPDLVNVFLRKAMADGVRGLVIVPTSIRRHSGGDGCRFAGSGIATAQGWGRAVPSAAEAGQAVGGGQRYSVSAPPPSEGVGAAGVRFVVQLPTLGREDRQGTAALNVIRCKCDQGRKRDPPRLERARDRDSESGRDPGLDSLAPSNLTIEFPVRSD